jgi:hypothetical protein
MLTLWRRFPRRCWSCMRHLVLLVLEMDEPLANLQAQAVLSLRVELLQHPPGGLTTRPHRPILLQHVGGGLLGRRRARQAQLYHEAVRELGAPTAPRGPRFPIVLPALSPTTAWAAIASPTAAPTTPATSPNAPTSLSPATAAPNTCSPTALLERLVRRGLLGIGLVGGHALGRDGLLGSSALVNRRPGPSLAASSPIAAQPPGSRRGLHRAYM